MLISEVLLIGGLVGAIVLQVLNLGWDVAAVLLLVVELVLVLLLVRVSVRRWRSTRNAAASSAPPAGYDGG